MEGKENEINNEFINVVEENEYIMEYKKVERLDEK